MLKQIKGRKVEIPDEVFYEGPDPNHPAAQSVDRDPKWPITEHSVSIPISEQQARDLEQAARGIPSAPKSKTREDLICLALDILSLKLMMLVAIVIAGMLFAFVALWPSWIRLAGASIFSLVVAFPIVHFYSNQD